MRVLQLAVGGFDHNYSYVIGSAGAAALVDPAGSWPLIREALDSDGISSLSFILLTHGHFDHRDALKAAKRDFPGVEVCGHPDNRAASRKLADGEELPLGECSVKVLFTPGHSPDSVCYLCGDSALLTGDTLFVDCVGNARDPEALYGSLKRLSGLPGETVIYPGHDYGVVPCRTLAEEKRLDPYLRCRTLEEFKIQLKESV